MSKKVTFLFLFPSIALVGCFIYALIGWNLLVSFSDWSGIIPSYNIVGLNNFIKLFNDPIFWTSVKNHLLLILLSVPSSLSVGLLLAILLDLKVKGESVFRTIYLLPFALSYVVTGTLWAWMYSPKFGVINSLLESAGLGFLKSGWITDASVTTSPLVLIGGLVLIIGLFGAFKGWSKWSSLALILGGLALAVGATQLGPTVAMYSVILALIWQFSGYTMLIFLAGIRSIPESQMMAADVDGASTFQKYRYIVIPQLKGPALTVFIILLIVALKLFDFVWVLTKGGPGYSTEILPITMYKETFIKSEFAYGAAIGTLLLVPILILIPFLYLRYIRGEKQ